MRNVCKMKSIALFYIVTKKKQLNGARNCLTSEENFLLIILDLGETGGAVWWVWNWRFCDFVQTRNGIFFVCWVIYYDGHDVTSSFAQTKNLLLRHLTRCKHVAIADFVGKWRRWKMLLTTLCLRRHLCECFAVGACSLLPLLWHFKREANMEVSQ